MSSRVRNELDAGGRRSRESGIRGQESAQIAALVENRAWSGHPDPTLPLAALRDKGGPLKLAGGNFGHLAQHGEDVLVLRRLAQLVGLGKNDFALLINEEDGAFVDAGQRLGGAKDAELLRHRAVGMEVAAQWVAEVADFEFLLRYVAEHRIAAHAQDLGIVLGEARQIALVRRGLRRSNRGPVQRVKGEQEMALAAVVGQTGTVLFLAGAGGNVEIGRGLARLERCHKCLRKREKNTSTS